MFTWFEKDPSLSYSPLAVKAYRLAAYRKEEEGKRRRNMILMYILTTGNDSSDDSAQSGSIHQHSESLCSTRQHFDSASAIMRKLRFQIGISSELQQRRWGGARWSWIKTCGMQPTEILLSIYLQGNQWSTDSRAPSLGSFIFICIHTHNTPVYRFREKKNNSINKEPWRRIGKPSTRVWIKFPRESRASSIKWLMDPLSLSFSALSTFE